MRVTRGGEEMESVKEGMVEFIPLNQRKDVTWYDCHNIVYADYISKKGRYMTVMYNKSKKAISNFPMA